MTALLSFLQRSAFRRFREGRRGPWGALAASIFGVRMLMRWSKRTEEVVYRGVVEPGEAITITHLTESAADRSAKEPGRRARRKARRAGPATTTDA